ncbi:phage tail terminator protein [Citreimonas salinaria]|uniref:DUF3168 domain-containing protein n=1 Tax=Citreimonas salinaria TaxID=321339 RepID=A0A1H3KTB5_9RHOB|nr:hypothetical protein [Citreimonas salinaria]SDY55412.1 hypothetical protein SAMN05444340_11098 [Citreimonas salinaria]
MLVAPLKTRLEGRVQELQGRLFTASDFMAVMESNVVPAGGVNGYLIPAGVTGVPTRGTGAISGFFTQEVRHGVSLVVLLRNVDRHGKRALDELDTFSADITAAVCGWAPDGVVGVFELQRAGVIETRHRGVLAYQFQFFITDQLRITP